MLSISRLSTYPRFEREALGNSEMAYFDPVFRYFVIAYYNDPLHAVQSFPYLGLVIKKNLTCPASNGP